MILSLNKEDLINLVAGISFKSYEGSSVAQHMKLGKMWGGMGERWEWDRHALGRLDELQLIRAYNQLKDL